MNVLSLFDGISCGQLALKKIGAKVDNYFASEIKKSAIKVTLDNFPDTIEIGDVNKVSFKNGVLYCENGKYEVGKIDLLIGGSPCQNFSVAQFVGANKPDKYGLQGKKSKLFFQYLRLLKEVEPRYFLLENVRMKKESEREISDYLGVDGIVINSSLVSYQNRVREYWTNIPRITVPTDKHISFQDYKSTDEWELAESKVKRTPSRERMWNNGDGITREQRCCKNITHSKKIGCLTRKQDRAPNSGLIECEDFCRYLTRSEMEQAQNLPIGYCKSISYSQVQDVTGDGWTVDVIAHIFSFMREKTMDRVVVGIDQSYQNCGIAIAINGEVFKVYNVHLKPLRNNTERRDELKNRLKDIIKELLKTYQPINILCVIERIRLQSQGFINIDYIKGIGALNACIVDTMLHYNINTYSVDTRAWKSQVVGTSKPQENRYGLPPEKYPTILWNVKNGRKKFIVDYCVGRKQKGVIEKNGKRYTYDNDRSDSIGIALYGFIPKSKQKLEQEH